MTLNQVKPIKLLTQILLAAFGSPALFAAPSLDPSKLPPAAQVRIAFEADIKPIFEKTCFRCHGPERPKSHFRLDNRESALKGGDNGIDIIPGDSAKSPLIHYVARLVEDMEMPPPGKGDPLTPAQVGILRAWIDQGAQWGATNPPVQLAFSAAPTLRWISVTGDKSKFREIEGLKESFGGGLEHFSLDERIGNDQKVSIEGRALFHDEEIRVKLALEKTDFGFVRAGFEQWRRYYDDTGGYYRPFPLPALDLNRNLHLDIGRAWIDLGLALPRWPQIVLGYEYQFRQGAKSMLEWGTVQQGGDSKKIYPAAKDIDEHVHIAKLDLTHDFHDWRIEDNARVEIYDLTTRHVDAARFTLGPVPDSSVQTREGFTHVQGMNTLRLERQVTDWWLFSGGYLYSKFDGDASLNQITVGLPGPNGSFWSSDQILLKREAHVFSLSSLFVAAEGLTFSAGVQNEWQRQEGFGKIHLDEGDPNVPEFFTLLPATIQSDLDKTKTMENVGLRFTQIPFTVLFAEARVEQEKIGQFEHADTSQAPPEVGQHEAFLRDTDATNDRREVRVGFNTSPWSWMTLSAHYKDRLSDSDYNHRRDTTPGYSAFIRERRIDGDELQLKLVLRPTSWLKTTFTYQLVATDYSTTTDPVPGGTFPEGLLAGRYNADIYGLNITLTPFQRCYFTGTFTYSDSKTTTAQNGSPSVVPYKGNVYSVLASATYVLSEATDLQASYGFSHSDYGQDNVADGLPLGLNYTRHGLMAGMTRRLTSHLTANLRYGFSQYSEPSAGGVNDYTAHGVFATMVVKWP